MTLNYILLESKKIHLSSKENGINPGEIRVTVDTGYEKTDNIYVFNNINDVIKKYITYLTKIGSGIYDASDVYFDKYRSNPKLIEADLKNAIVNHFKEIGMGNNSKVEIKLLKLPKSTKRVNTTKVLKSTKLKDFIKTDEINSITNTELMKRIKTFLVKKSTGGILTHTSKHKGLVSSYYIEFPFIEDSPEVRISNHDLPQINHRNSSSYSTRWDGELVIDVSARWWNWNNSLFDVFELAE